MSREYTLKEVEKAARDLRIEQTGEYSCTDNAMEEGADILDAYAATLRQHAARVDGGMVDRAVKAAYSFDTTERLHIDYDTMEVALEAALSAQPAVVSDGMEPSRRKPPLPKSPLGEQDFCFCGESVSLQHVSGGGHKDGYLGRVTLKIGGEYVEYVRDQPAPESDMRYFSASEAACFEYPGADQAALRDAYCKGAAREHAQAKPTPERQGEAIGEIGEGAWGCFVELYPDRDLPLGAKVYTHPAAPVDVPDGWVLVAIERGEGYEDVHPDLVAEDCMQSAVERGWKYQVLSAPQGTQQGEG